jgi:hypothetical protein
LRAAGGTSALSRKIRIEENGLVSQGDLIAAIINAKCKMMEELTYSQHAPVKKSHVLSP